MAVPKRRTSRSNTRKRRAQWKATPPDLVPITVAGRRHLVRAAWSAPTSGGC
jgi:large subunit ribosomal protein L32